MDKGIGLNMIKYTIFTPTYNRQDLLPRVYESICAINRDDFEWVVVDDGSQDGTKDLVKSWVEEADFSIKYIYQGNSGKHVAYNTMVKHASGEFVFAIDSDDRLLPSVLDDFEKVWNEISDDDKKALVGVVGLYEYPDGEIIGTKYPRPKIACPSYDFKERHGVKGDKFGINKLSVLKQYPFPENVGRFISEGVVWNDIAQKYKQYPVNIVFACAEYQTGGLSDLSINYRAKYAKGSVLNYEVYLKAKRKFPLKYLLRAKINFVRFSLHNSEINKGIINSCLWKKPIYVPFVLTAGYLMYIKDIYNLRKTK